LARGWGRCGLNPLAPEQSPNVIGVVDDLELVANDVDDPPARPEARGVARRFRPRHDQARQLLPLHGRQLRRSARGRPRSKPGAALPPMRTLPSAHRAPIHPQPLGHDMNGDVTLQQLDRA
jgi:hypothetical protein